MESSSTLALRTASFRHCPLAHLQRHPEVSTFTAPRWGISLAKTPKSNFKQSYSSWICSNIPISSTLYQTYSSHSPLWHRWHLYRRRCLSYNSSSVLALQATRRTWAQTNSTPSERREFMTWAKWEELVTVRKHLQETLVLAIKLWRGPVNFPYQSWDNIDPCQ